MEHSGPSTSRRKKIVLAAVAAVAATLAYVALRRPWMPAFHAPSGPPVIITSGVVQANDVFAPMLAKHKLDRATVASIEKSFGSIYKIPSIQPGHHYEITTSTDMVFKKFIYHTDPIHSFTVVRSTPDNYTAMADTLQTIWKEKRVKVQVNRILEVDLRNAGYDPT